MNTNQLDAIMASNFASLDTLWVMIAAALVFFMQAGFKVLETGLVKHEHRSGIGVKNLMDWVAGSLAFFLLGFGFMFGTSFNGVIGLDFFGGLNYSDGYTFVFFIFQLAFAGTALTIVSGAMSGRTALLPYFVASLFTAVFVYPIFGHWAWGNLLIESNEPWLASMGFMDFAGSTVVHSVGAWVGLVGIYMVGPRLGRFSAKGKMLPVKASDYSYSILGVMILWFGWWGFNGGSTLAFNEDVVKIILNTNLAAAAATLSAYIHAKIGQKNKDVVEKIIGGALTGLVAITACCNVVTTTDSIVIGLLAGLLHNYAYVFIGNVLKLDDPVGAIPVHGFGGMFGTLCVALFGEQELLPLPRMSQLGVQAFGVLVCFVFTTAIAFVVFTIVKSIFGLRLSPSEEMSGAVFRSTDEEITENIENIVSQVSVRISERAYNLFSVSEYLNMPRETRIRLIKTDGVQYLDDKGNIIPPLEAVRYLSGVLEEQRDEADSERTTVEGLSKSQQSALLGGMQGVLLGEEFNIVSVFHDSFVLHKAKNEVSTDFFWHGKEQGYRIAVVASCSDQDVPNAFLSALTVSLLNEVVGLKKILPPEKILEYLDKKLTLALKETTRNVNASKGVEMGVFVVNTHNSKIYFAGAGPRVLLYSCNVLGVVDTYTGIDVPLGRATTATKQFRRHAIDYTSGEAFYLCTRGYANQINNLGTRYSSKRLKERFADFNEKTMVQQKLLFNAELEKWKGSDALDEDVMMIGIKF